MAERVVLHIGLMKSGTTFIQGRLNANRERLAEQGVLFPGPTWARHARAVSDLIGGRGAKPGAWVDLRDEINAHPGTAVVSMEYLGPILVPRITQVAEDFAGSDVQVIATVRDLGRTVPAMWQETVKNRQTWSWAEYVAAIEKRAEPGKKFWRQQDAARVVKRWSEVFGPDHVTVVTVPPPGAPHELLWERFSSVAGIADADWDEAPRANESLGVASALLMLRLNQELADLDLKDYKRKGKALAKHVLVHRRRDEDPIGFEVPRWLHRRASTMVDDLRASGVRIVGTLDDLRPLDVPGANPSR